jgi:hypothetical protein
MNDEMEMKGGRGMKCKPPYSERMLNVFNPHLSAPDEKAVVYNFALPNPGEICCRLAGAYNSNSRTRRPLLSYFWMQKQARKSLQLA